MANTIDVVEVMARALVDFGFTFDGGEPLLERDDCERLSQAAAEGGE